VSRPAGGTAKRLFDVVASTLVLIVAAPAMLLITLAVGVSSPGGALFRQTRLGLGGRPFALYKFRTMYVGCPDDIHRDFVQRLLRDDAPGTARAHGLFKIESDPRVTPVGRLLRRTSLDELPQLFNVMRGEMSLVGPRPVLAWEAAQFRPEHLARFSVRPGLTGLWQVSGRNRLTMTQALDLDLDYVRSHGFALDTMILLKTVPTVLMQDGAR
jgi:lipopolysaccharide/colanic/teichoic acid biosynthesis glycosyltransferase